MAKGYLDFECPTCGKMAGKGVTVVTINRVPAVSRLGLECPSGKHVDWEVNEKCPKCGGVPKYREHPKGEERLPVLECCGAAWHPIKDGEINRFLIEENRFLDERII